MRRSKCDSVASSPLYGHGRCTRETARTHPRAYSRTYMRVVAAVGVARIVRDRFLSRRMQTSARSSRALWLMSRLIGRRGARDRGERSIGEDRWRDREQPRLRGSILFRLRPMRLLCSVLWIRAVSKDFRNDLANTSRKK